MSKTRNERKQAIIDRIIAVLAVFAVFAGIILFLCGMACKVWVYHPAEQPITYEQHMARFGGVSE